ncbi:endoplasmic reticulum transmembrane protein [Pseudoscourfieldia marina]
MQRASLLTVRSDSADLGGPGGGAPTSSGSSKKNDDPDANSSGIVAVPFVGVIDVSGLRSKFLRDVVTQVNNDPVKRSMAKGVLIGFFVAFLVFYVDIFNAMGNERAQWRQTSRLLASERDEYKKALEIVESKMVQSEAQVLVAQKTATGAVDRATAEVRATQGAAKAAMGDVVSMKDSIIKKHKGAAEREARSGMKHRLEAEATKVHLKTASSELKKVEAAEDAWDRFHQQAVSRSVRYGSHTKVPNIPHPDADDHAAKIVTGWRLGQRLAIRGGEGGVHSDGLMKSAVKSTETFGFGDKKKSGRKLLARAA